MINMSEIEDLFGNIMKPFETMPKELQITNIALQLAITGLNKGLTPKDVIDYFFEIVSLMKTHKKTK
jgi:hypothetical protein